MCGIFGVVGPGDLPWPDVWALARFAQRRGSDASGVYFATADGYRVVRAQRPVRALAGLVNEPAFGLAMGHSRLATNGEADNQPVLERGVCVVHNGIIVNEAAAWEGLGRQPKLQTDTEVIAAIAVDSLERGDAIETIADRVLQLCAGSISAAVALPGVGKVLLFTNTGSLYSGHKDGRVFFASERFPLTRIGCGRIDQVNDSVVLDIPAFDGEPSVTEIAGSGGARLPALGSSAAEEALLEYRVPDLRRCTRCILPETMPFISFDAEGVCNYCHAYTPRNTPRPVEELRDLLEPYRRGGSTDCIVPFSGGRDSTFGLHLVVKELGMRPIAYTYDWGMVTDLGRRNVSRMCAQLGVENIVVADDIPGKRRNIATNLRAWLEAPHLGLLSLLTAGDKHFYRHIEPIKHETGVSLNLWGVNPLEVTHFKAGFLGVPPDFEEKRVYQHGWQKQARYHALRFKAMTGSPKYFNRSLWDTLSGEYYRSIRSKTDYFHIFDYWRWDERTVEDTLDLYDWERAPDTQATWRIGDGTAAFYNYVYFTAAGFTEHDTFRSNQIREGDIDRATALEMVLEENRPRYPNIKWYLDALGGFDFGSVVRRINTMPKVPAMDGQR